ncbi:hypothetical protein ACIBI9_64445 [Nonomuraea sp. NPDC050451]|uniref:KUP/HAK/KT family potassium transporter n=1 Tax=Nonomuraea sp. NPDC050451 TaxID=3364364 RepID=UPI0037999D12
MFDSWLHRRAKALSPTYAIGFLTGHFGITFFSGGGRARSDRRRGAVRCSFTALAFASGMAVTGTITITTPAVLPRGPREVGHAAVDRRPRRSRLPATVVEHNHVRHDHVLIMSIETEPARRVPAGRRIAVDDGIIHVTARFGYMQAPDVLGALAMLGPATTEGRLRLEQASSFLSKIELRRGPAPTMAPWRKRPFIATSYITADAAE